MEAQEQEAVTPQTPEEVMLSETGMQKGDSPGEYKESPTVDEPEPETPPKESADTPKEAPADTEGTDWKKRHGDAVRWAQQQKAEAERIKQELEQERQRIQKYVDAGLDFAELDKFIEGNTGTPSGGNQMDTSTNAQPQQQPQDNAVTKSELNNIITRYNYDMAKRDYSDANPEFRDSDYQELLDVEANKLAAQEMQQYGSVTSQVDELVREAGKKVNARINKFVEKGKKTATETRQKITEAAVPEGDTNKKPSMDADDEVAYSPKGYAKDIRNFRAKIKQRPNT